MFVQPQIVSVGEDFYDENLYYIVIEGFTFCTIEGNCILSPIYTTEKTWSGPPKKLVRTRYFCRVNLSYHGLVKRIRTHFFLVLGP